MIDLREKGLQKLKWDSGRKIEKIAKCKEKGKMRNSFCLSKLGM